MGHLLILSLMLACGQDDTAQDSTHPDSDTPDASEVTLAGACALDVDYGGFTVSDDGVQGVVADGVVPISVLEAIATDGDCQLMRRNNPYCHPACDPGFTCDFDGECLPYPVNQDLGIVSIDGLASPVTLEPVFPGNTYYDTSLPAPPFEAGALVTLRMPEGVYGPATLYGVGVETIAPLDDEWVVEAGVDMQVRWEPPTGDVHRGEIALRVNIDQHGTTPGTLWCSFEDDGEGTVPAGILATLVQTGVTGFPSGSLARLTQDHTAAAAGCMDFAVSSSATVRVDVIGYTSCVSDADCPDGQECNEELQICEDVAE